MAGTASKAPLEQRDGRMPGRKAASCLPSRSGAFMEAKAATRAPRLDVEMRPETT